MLASPQRDDRNRLNWSFQLELSTQRPMQGVQVLHAIGHRDCATDGCEQKPGNAALCAQRPARWPSGSGDAQQGSDVAFIDRRA